MPKANHQKNLIFMSTVFLAIILGTIIVTLLARGYRLNIKNGFTLNPSGLLSVTSVPKPASVFINDRLITATDDTLNLPPTEYDIKITRDGYLPWQKNIMVKKEIVSLTDAHLFKSAPSLEPLSLSGAINPTISPDKTKIVYVVASASATTSNGLYLNEFSNTPLGTKTNPKLLIQNSAYLNWSQVISFEFSPDSTQVLANFTNATYLIDLANPNKPVYDITIQVPLIKKDWQDEEQKIIANKTINLPLELIDFISTQSATHVQISPNKDKVLYLSSKDGLLDNTIITPPPSQSNQTQHRLIKAGQMYVYDLKQDTNFLLTDISIENNPFWLPNSNHIIYSKNDKLMVVEYDNTNTHTLFSNQFDQNITAPWVDGSKIVIYTSTFTPNQPNLYTVGIR